MSFFSQKSNLTSINEEGEKKPETTFGAFPKAFGKKCEPHANTPRNPTI